MNFTDSPYSGRGQAPRDGRAEKGAPGAGGAEEKTLCPIPGGTTGNAGGGGGQGQRRSPPRPV